MKKVFISGKITGENIYECVIKFKAAHNFILFNDVTKFRINEHEIIIPLFLEGIYFGVNWLDAMKICIKELKTCSHIYMLKDWKDSKGAQIEHQFALDNNIKIVYQ